jgi:hypothetical protein
MSKGVFYFFLVVLVLLALGNFLVLVKGRVKCNPSGAIAVPVKR